MAIRIPLSVPAFEGNEARYLQACIDEGWVASKGRFVSEFEQRFASVQGTSGAVSTSSGTAALHLALVELGLGPGDEVIVPVLTFAATANPVCYVGATPVFADVDPVTYCLDAASVADAVTERTRAIVPVHLYGHPVDMDPILDLAGDHDLWVIEDATEALGASYRGRPCGTLGSTGAFSFNGNKVITAGGGGMLVADEPQRLEHLRHLSLQARVPGSQEYLHDEVGFNYSLSNLQAAVGLAQLECLTEKLAARAAVAERYVDGLADIEDLRFCSQAEWAQSNFWLMSVLVDPKPRGRTRDSVMVALADRGIAARPFFAPLSDLPPYSVYAENRDFPVARWLHAHALSIPSSPTLTPAEQEEVIEALRDG
jgi:perosamine synthetase